MDNQEYIKQYRQIKKKGERFKIAQKNFKSLSFWNPLRRIDMSVICDHHVQAYQVSQDQKHLYDLKAFLDKRLNKQTSICWYYLGIYQYLMDQDDQAYVSFYKAGRKSKNDIEKQFYWDSSIRGTTNLVDKNIQEITRIKNEKLVVRKVVAENNQSDYEYGVFISCDTHYFEQYFDIFFQSLSHFSSKFFLNVTLVNPNEADVKKAKNALKELKNYKLVTETLNATNLKPFYTVSRFLSAQDFFEKESKPVCIFDIDMMINKDVGRYIKKFENEYDLIGRGALKKAAVPWRSMGCGFMCFYPTELAKALLKNACTQMLHVFQPHWGSGKDSFQWWIDQAPFAQNMMYMAQNNTPIKFKRLTNKELPLEFGNMLKMNKQDFVEYAKDKLLNSKCA